MLKFFISIRQWCDMSMLELKLMTSQKKLLVNTICTTRYLYVEIQKGMYGLQQAGILAQQSLEQQLNKLGY
jgi:hypothetical protein